MAIVNKADELRSRQREFISMLQEIPYSQVDSYIDNHVTSLSSARTYLKKLTKVVLYLVKTGGNNA